MKLSEHFRLGLKYRQDPLYAKYLMGRRLLDVGCGHGEFLVRDPKNFIGIDLNESLVAQCVSRGLAAEVMSAFELKFPDESFDAVHAAQLIEHLAPVEAIRFLAEAARVIRPGGIVFLTTPGVRNVWGTFSHIRPYPPQAFRKLLTKQTEAYVGNGALPLIFELGLGVRWYIRNRELAFMARALDILIPPADPIGWSIVLRKRVS